MSRNVRHLHRLRGNTNSATDTTGQDTPTKWVEVMKADDLGPIAERLGVTLTGNRREDNSAVWAAIKAQ